MNRRAMQARAYLTLARLTSRATYISGLILAASVLRILSFILMLLLAMSYHSHAPGIGIQGATLANMLPGALGVLLYTIFLSALTVFLMAPTATRITQIIFLAWLAALLYSNTGPSLLANYLSFTHVPLAPITACYNFGVTGIIDTYGFIMVTSVICYIVVLFWLCSYCFKQRDLIMLTRSVF